MSPLTATPYGDARQWIGNSHITVQPTKYSGISIDGCVYWVVGGRTTMRASFIILLVTIITIGEVTSQCVLRQNYGV